MIIRRAFLAILVATTALTIVACSNESTRTEPIMETRAFEVTTEPDVTETSEPVVYEYDILQKLFLQINDTTRMEHIEEFAKEYELPYTAEKYNGGRMTYCVAFKKEVSLQSYGESGESVSITFNKSENTVMHCEYSDGISSGICIYYVNGVYWDFRDGMDDSTKGYYWYQPGSSATDGAVLKFKNGYEEQSRYYKVKSGEEALNSVLKLRNY